LPLPLPLAPTLFAQAEAKGLPEIIDSLARTPLSQVVLFVAVLTAIRVALAPSLSRTPPHLRTGAYKGLRLVNEFLDAIVYAGVFVFLIIRPFGVQAFRIPSGSMWPTLFVNDFVVANKMIYRYSDPKAGDVVVFRPPAEAVGSAGLDEDGQVKQDFIKRCVGTPGDLVELKDGILYRNGEKSPDPTKAYSSSPDQGQTFSPIPPEQAARPSFKLVEYPRGSGQVIPLNYTPDEANNGEIGEGYNVASKYVVPTVDQRKLIDAPAVKVPSGFYLMMGDNRNNSYDSRGWGLVARDRIIGRSEFRWLPISRMGRTPAVDLGK